jgi:DNA-binding PadR family transcriptional regulator
MHDFWRGFGHRHGHLHGRDWRELMMRGGRRGHHHGHDHEHRHGHKHGGRGVGRFLAHGDLRFLILDLIAETPRHGYEIIKAIEDSVAGLYSPSPGVVYPTLTLLEELGWVRAIEAESGRKRYEATDEGRAALAANKATLDAIRERLAEARASHRRGADPAILGAMERLKRGLMLRVALRPLTEAETAAVADALNKAADVVENLDRSPEASE